MAAAARSRPRAAWCSAFLLAASRASASVRTASSARACSARSRVRYRVEEIDENNLTWCAGGGVLLFFGRSAGIRFDVRYFRTFDDLEIRGIPIAQSPGKVDFTRGSLGFVFRF